MRGPKSGLSSVGEQYSSSSRMGRASIEEALFFAFVTFFVDVLSTYFLRSISPGSRFAWRCFYVYNTYPMQGYEADIDPHYRVKKTNVQSPKLGGYNPLAPNIIVTREPASGP